MALSITKTCQICGMQGIQQAKIQLKNQMLRQHISYKKCLRYSSYGGASKMRAWQVHQYGGVDELTLSDFAKAATIKGPNELIVKVNASSVNPIDVRMMDGYGHKLINILRNKEGVTKAGTEFPLVLGRDFSGTVVETGRGVKKYRVGDEVWGALYAWRPGTHAEFTVVSQDEISLKPSNLHHSEAASLPYVAATTWAALCTVGQLTENGAMGKRLLVLGGSGGIGSFAIQLGKAWGMHVTVTCQADSHSQAKGLGADVAVDYTDPGLWRDLGQGRKFDMILDTAGGETTHKAARLMSPSKLHTSKLVSLNFPLLHNTDNEGVLPGLVKSVFSAGMDTLKGLQSGGSVRWAVFMPSAKAMDKVRRMVEAKQIKPVIQEVFPFEESQAAYRRVADGHLRGKIVISTSDSPPKPL